MGMSKINMSLFLQRKANKANCTEHRCLISIFDGHFYNVNCSVMQIYEHLKSWVFMVKSIPYHLVFSLLRVVICFICHFFVVG